MPIATRFAAPRDEQTTSADLSYLWYGDFVGAYLELRERGITEIGRAVEALGEGGPVTPATFDTIADGLFIYRVELEDGEELGVRGAAR
jgi:hypothetical protein